MASLEPSLPLTSSQDSTHQRHRTTGHEAVITWRAVTITGEGKERESPVGLRVNGMELWLVNIPIPY